MLNRRSMLTLMAGATVAPKMVFAADAPTLKPAPYRLALYANVGPELWHYDVNLNTAELTRRGSVKLPANVQYAWPHRSGRALYVVSSNGQSGKAGVHHATALRLDHASGEAQVMGAPVALPDRPINVCTDIPSKNLLVAFNQPSGVRIFRIKPDMTLGGEVKQGKLDGGVYAHQIRVTNDNRHAILVTRGNDSTPTKAEDPGALKFFDYADGRLSHEYSVAPNGGIGFGPRHLDFHPAKPWVYVSLERESRLFMYRLTQGKLETKAAYDVDTLKDRGDFDPRQLAGAIHVHPNGKFVYVANRADGTVDYQGRKVFKGGENSIAVYAIDQATGEPRVIQFADTNKIYPRTFYIDPTGSLLVAEHNIPLDVRDGERIRPVQAGLTVFRIGDDGKLTLARNYDVDVGKDTMFWAGMVAVRA
ncbi:MULTISPECIES: beta-propeller fold lactonase family protein [unclassified Achromobacter]|uniref:lactonase family protein n=1 Tax=unclassified Achromobacter TaxID=2626865 RepID=UPI000B519824|nr:MULTISPECIES: beta-propeller fold lactonase family protein [unclassified Achromobacter]OWT77118.1 3-carboxymuconate cyclase [Achromobacter sp. HZ28]OWT77999.1 3-carboxymuconate cyclase [Achromobacter sp. HZ34]